jgi:amidase
MLDATSGPDIGAPHHAPPPARPFLEEVGTDPGKLRIAFTAEPFRPAAVHDDCVKGLEATVTLCRDLGHELMEDAPQIDGQAFERAYSTIICGEIRAAIEEMANVFGRRATSRDFEPVTWAAGLLGNTFSASDFAKAVHVLNFTTRQVCQFFEEYDVLLTPALARPPVMTGELQPQGVEAFALKLLGRLNAGRLISTLTGTRSLGGQFLEFTPYTPLFNATGQPAMSVPLHWNDEGLPIGMHFVGRYGDEATLFRLAGQLERVEPWFDRNPPVNSLENPQ